MSFPTVAGKAVEGVPYREAQSCLGPAYAGATYRFFLSGTSTPANVYQDAALTTPFPTTGLVAANNFGRFQPIYLDTSVIYKVQFFDSTNALRWTVNAYTAPLSTLGTSSLSAFGMTIQTTGEFTILAPNSGGTGTSLTLKAGSIGSAPLQISAPLPGSSALIVNSSATTGAQTATFTATNKPGTAASSPAGWLPIFCDGVQYYTPIWHGNNFTPYVSSPTALGEFISASTVTFNGNGGTSVTNGTATPSSWFAPTTTNIGAGYYIKITKFAGPSGINFSAANGVWTNITSGGLTISTNAGTAIGGTYQLSTSVTGSPVVASGTMYLGGNNGVQVPTYNGAANLVLGGDGTATLNGVTASNWFTPTTGSTGSGYWINITQTGGTSGFSFSAASGVWTNITNGGLTIGISGTPVSTYNVTGTYTIASDSGGVNQLGSGSITLTGGTLVQSPNYSGTTPLNLAGNGAATLNGSATSSWYSPNAANVGSGYYINITRTGGPTGVNFSAAQGSWTNITNSGLTIDSTFYPGASLTGNYQISSSSGGTPVLGSGTITLTQPNNVLSSSWSGTTPLSLAGNGTATLNGSATSSWYSPTTTNVGSNYWINITRTGGTTGVNFSAAQGSATNISNSGLIINMTGYSGYVGTVNVTGSYVISSSSSGTPNLGSGTISLSVNAGTIINIHTTAGSGTETIPTNTTTVKCEVWGSGGGAGAKSGSGSTTQPGFSGGAGGFAYSSYAASSLGGAGKTLTYTVTNGGAGAASGVGTAGTAGTIVAGTATGFTTMTANGGAGGTAGSGAGGGAGGTASGGNTTNTTGGTNNIGGTSGSIGGDGSPYGGGGVGGLGAGGNGKAGAAVFQYS